MKRMTKRLLAILLCIAVLPVEGIAVRANDTATEPPAYLRELSRLVMETASEDDFGEIRLTVGESEMQIDSETKPIADDESIVPYVDDNDVLQIPAGVIGEADAVGDYVTEEALEAQGYAVSFDEAEGDVRITEPYGLGRLVVKTADGTVANTYGAVRTLAISDNKTVLQYADKQSAAAAAEQLRADPAILACAADRIVSVDMTTQDAEPTNINLVGGYGNTVCWGTTRTGADEWMQTHANDDLAEVVVAVIDTGVDASHPFLEGRIQPGGWDFVNDDNDPMDDHYHGTHCAGIVRDATPANVKILPVKVLSYNGEGDTFVAYEAMRWAVDQGADILSMSFGATLYDLDAEEFEQEWSMATDAVRYVRDAGAISVTAAGNSAYSLDTHADVPAGLEHVITVANICNMKDELSPSSNFGSAIDIAAPGTGVVSCIPDNKYESLSGTSMSCPLVAGICANFLSLDKSQTPDEVRDVLIAHAEDIYMPGWDEKSGAGLASMREYTPVSGVSVQPEKLRMTIGMSISLVYAIQPSNATVRTVWITSSAPNVVSVTDFGEITARSVGDAVITIRTVDGDLTAQCSVCVSGGSGVRALCTTNENLFALRTDGTVQYNGFSQPRLGNSDSYWSSWGIVRDPERMPITGITKYWVIPAIGYTGTTITDLEDRPSAYYEKEDGRLRWIDADGNSVLQKTTDGKILTDVKEISGKFILDEAGRVYTYADGLWETVRKPDGSALRDVRHLGVSAAFCADGSVWYMTDEYGGRNYVRSHAALFEPIPDAVDGFIVPVSSGDTENPYSAVLLRADGTVWGVGSNMINFFGMPDVANTQTPVQITYADGQPLTGVTAIHFTRFAVYALREDGTVLAWGATNQQTKTCHVSDYLGTGEPCTERSYPKPVVVEDGSLLTDVQSLLPACGGRMLFQRGDGGVWICGFNEYGPPETAPTLGSATTKRMINYAAPLKIGEDPVYLLNIPLEPFEPVVPVRRIILNTDSIYLGAGDSFQLEATVLPANADNPQVFYQIASLPLPNLRLDLSPTGLLTGRFVEIDSDHDTTIVRAYAFDAPADVYAECTVTVGSARMESIQVSTLPDKTTYDLGEPLDTTGGELFIRLENGETAQIPLQALFCKGYDPQRPGWQRVTVDYIGLTAAFNVFVTRKEPVSLELTEPDKTEYLPGESFDLTGGKVTIRYSDGTQATVPLTEEMCSPPFRSDTESVQTITVEYLGLRASFIVRVRPKTICGIRMFEMPDKLSYSGGETQIDPTGGSIVYVYEDGTLGDVLPLTAQMCDSAAIRRLGEREVTVTHGSLRTSFTVQVTQIPGATLSMHTLPDCQNYIGLDPIHPHGGSLLVQYPDGSSEVVELQQSMCGTPTPYATSAASWEIPVTYAGLTTSFTAYNYRKKLNFTVDHIEMARVPDNTELRGRFSKLDPTGGVVRLCGANGQTMDVAISRKMFMDAEDTSAQGGEHTMRVQIEGCQTSFVYYVRPRMPECRVVKLPDRTVFMRNEKYAHMKLRRGGIYAYKQYDADGTLTIVEKAFPTDYLRYTGFDPTQVGAQTITVMSPGGTEEPMFSFTVYVTDFTIRNEASVMQVGQSTLLRPDYRYVPEEEQTITWTSSDPSVVKVCDKRHGRVTAVGVGTAQITAKVNDDCFATCTVTVQQEDIEPTQLVLSQTPDMLDPGNTVQIPASCLPVNAAARPITWTSSDPSVLTVDETGTVTAIRGGTARITARIESAGLKKSCSIRVRDGEIEPTGLAFAQSTDALSAGDSAQFAVSFLPQGAAARPVTWTSSDPSVLTVDEAGMVTAIGPGTAQITARIEGTQIEVSQIVTVPDIPPEPAGKLTLALSGGTARPGETVAATVNVTENPGLASLRLFLQYDPAVLTLTDVQDGGLIGTGTFTPGNDLTAVPYTVLWNDALAQTDHTGTGTLVTFVFTVNADAAAGDTAVSVQIDPVSTFNSDLQSVAYTIQNGSITVGKRIAGDANGDGQLDLKDVIAIRRFLAGWHDVTVDAALADVDGDGHVTLRDCTLISRFLAGGWDVVLQEK